MKKMKKCLALTLAFLLAVTVTACGSSSSSEPTGEAGTPVETEETVNDTAESSSVVADTDGRTLVAYFAYSENIRDTSDMEVDAIASASLNRSTDNTDGNLQVMAQVIAEETGADVFHILVEEPYDPDYSTMLPVAVQQMENEDWPALQEKIENLADYDVIYLGTPVWNASLPPALHTFFSENDLSGKTIVPFGIHLGSRFGRILDEIEELAPGATVADGFTISADTPNDEARSEFVTWLAENGNSN